MVKDYLVTVTLGGSEVMAEVDSVDYPVTMSSP